jgi:hypothetical protein
MENVAVDVAAFTPIYCLVLGADLPNLFHRKLAFQT